MKKLFTMLENLWVVITFAEEGIYEPAAMYDHLIQNHNTVAVPIA